MRSFKVTAAAHPHGSAVFTIVVSPGKVEGVRYVSGTDALKPMADLLARVKYNVDFPDAGPVNIVRRGILSCGARGCDFVLLLPEDAYRSE